MSRENGADAPSRQGGKPTSRLELVQEALAVAEACKLRGDDVGWIAAVTIAAQLVQLEKLFGGEPTVREVGGL